MKNREQIFKEIFDKVKKAKIEELCWSEDSATRYAYIYAVQNTEAEFNNQSKDEEC